VNLYLVVSEELSYEATIDFWIGGPMEPYWICDLVIARSHAQAKYLAWKNDHDSFPSYWSSFDMREMPKMAVRLKKRDVPGPARIASAEYNGWQDDNWRLWALLTPAPHIGIPNPPSEAETVEMMAQAEEED